MYYRWSLAAVLVPVLLIVSCSNSSIAGALSQSKMEMSLKLFLQNYVKARDLQRGKDTRYFVAFIDLNADGKKETIVHLVGTLWCGSGGCSTLILSPEGSSYKVITKILATDTPIRVLNKTSHNWRSLGVWDSGRAGDPLPYEVELSFDGKNYVFKGGSVAIAGEVVISGAPKEEKTLFP